MVVWPILSSLIMIFILIVPGVFFKKEKYSHRRSERCDQQHRRQSHLALPGHRCDADEVQSADPQRQCLHTGGLPADPGDHLRYQLPCRQADQAA